MKIKDFDELELQLNDIGAKLSIVKSLSKVMSEAIYEQFDDNPQDIQNLMEVLKDKISEVKNKFEEVQVNLGM